MYRGCIGKVKIRRHPAGLCAVQCSGGVASSAVEADRWTKSDQKELTVSISLRDVCRFSWSLSKSSDKRSLWWIQLQAAVVGLPQP